LDSSREFIDPQGGNLWFNYTNEKLSYFMKNVYIDLAERVKEKIVCYLPKKNECFFNIDNEKASCLKIDSFHGAILLEEKLFFTSANTFEKPKDVVSFKANEKIDNWWNNEVDNGYGFKDDKEVQDIIGNSYIAFDHLILRDIIIKRL